MKNITSFYKKAKTYKNIFGFFEICSNVERDECRDYEDPFKYISKVTSPDRQARIANLNHTKKSYFLGEIGKEYDELLDIQLLAQLRNIKTLEKHLNLRRLYELLFDNQCI